MNDPKLASFYGLLKAAVHGAECDALPVNELGNILRPMLYPDDVEYPTRAAAKILNKSMQTLQRWRMQGIGPEHRRDGSRQVVYTAKALHDYQAGVERVCQGRPTQPAEAA